MAFDKKCFSEDFLIEFKKFLITLKPSFKNILLVEEEKKIILEDVSIKTELEEEPT